MNDAFENSIRNKLNEADIPFDQDAWKKMESLLDAGDNNTRPAGWWWLFLLPLLGALGWWVMQPSTADKKTADTAVSVQKTNDKLSTATDNTPGKRPNEGVSRKVNNHQLAGSTSAENETGNSKQATEKRSAENDINNAGKHLPKAKQVERKLNNEPAKQLPGESPTTGGENTTGTATPPVVNTTGANYSLPAAKDSISIPPQNDIHLIKIKNITNYNGYTKITRPSEIPVNTDKQPDRQSAAPGRKINSKGLQIGVTLGPDLNVAPSLNYGKVGFNLGVLAHYYFDRHWFVTTGAVYSKKLYGATKTDYTTPDNVGVPYDLVKVNANCDVLDIPINMNYTFLQVNNNTLSATLGISNYFMLKEKYEYLYKDLPKWEKTVENENQHYLAILNVGALYQQPAGKRLIVGVQPYAKIPLRGVGLGQVKLYSAGVSFQLNLVGKKR